MKFKPVKVNSTESIVYEVITDFAREYHVINKYDNCYIISADLKSSDKLRLFIECPEELMEVYYFDEADSYFIRYLFKNSEAKDIIKISWDVMSKYSLVRIIPPNEVSGMDSYYRVVLKPDFKSAKPISLEDEIYNSKK
jgi:hypothetical protein